MEFVLARIRLYLLIIKHVLNAKRANFTTSQSAQIVVTTVRAAHPQTHAQAAHQTTQMSKEFANVHFPLH